MLSLCSSKGARRWPVVSLLLLLPAVFLQGWPEMALAFQFDRGEILDGAMWRLFTGHWTHWSHEHFAWDAAAFFLLAALSEIRSWRSTAVLLLSSALAISLALLALAPDLDLYRGLSGLDSALFVYLAVAGWRDSAGKKARSRKWIFGLALFLFVSKVLVEAFSNSAIFLAMESSDVVVVPLAHVAGGIVGAVIAWCPVSLKGAPSSV